MHTADDIWWREKSCNGAAIQHFFLSSGKRYGKMKQKTIQNQTTKRKRDHDMKYMFASDVHGSAYYCRKMLETYKKEQAERLVLLGDLLYHGPRNDLPKEYAPKEVIKMLNGMKQEIYAVRGNCEAEVDQMVLEFPILADYCFIELDGHTIFATHGHHHNPANPPMLKKGEILLNGHTHIPANQDMADFIYMNPGSVSIPKENSAHGYMIYDQEFIWKDLDGNVIDMM